MDNIISYASFLKDRENFQSSGTKTGSEFNIYDTPSHKFFKILFYFWNSDSNNDINRSSGLLAPTWEIYDSVKQNLGRECYYMFDSAWAYLKNNYENERAEKLEQFVTLLSNINCESPWYFNEVVGIGDALTRKVTSTNELKLEEERKKISIKCLPDAYDNRIETLLSLYRDITWSWSNKREVIPANLRKFDMGIYIWESPIYALNTNAVLDDLSSEYSASYKLIEFHNCEIDYDSLKYGYENLTNKEGIIQEFTIDIFFDDCYEHTYNSLMMRTIGDVITTDTAVIVYSNDSIGALTPSVAQGEESSYYNNINKIFDNEFILDNNITEATTRDNYWMNYELDADRMLITEKLLPGHKGPYKEKGLVGNLLSEVGGAMVRDIKSSATRLLLGNLYTYSISKMADQLKGVLNGQVSTTLNIVDDYAGTNIMSNIHNNSLSNLAGKGQKLLNDHVNNRKNGRTSNQINSLGSMGDADSEYKPVAGQPYSNTKYDKMDPANSIGRDIFPTQPTSNRIQSLGNLNQARTLINNI